MAVGGSTNTRIQRKVVRMVSSRGQHVMDDAATIKAAKRVVQLAAVFRLLRRSQDVHALFRIESEPISLKHGCV